MCTIAWDPIARVDPLEDGTCRLLFIAENIPKHEIDKNKITERFEELSASRPVSSLQSSV